MRTLILPWGALALSLCACGSASPAPAFPPAASSATVSPSPVVAGPKDHTLTRSAVHAVVGQGLGAFLQRVELDDKPVRVGGQFHGFRIAALHDATFWSAVDLKPGDVVTRVNGFPIERPEQAQTAFESLEVAGELRVSYDRDGEPRELVYPIVDR
jgi:S1-C subfamily serine protease